MYSKMEVVHLGASTSMSRWHKQASWVGVPDACGTVISVTFPQLMPMIPWGIVSYYLKSNWKNSKLVYGWVGSVHRWKSKMALKDRRSWEPLSILSFAQMHFSLSHWNIFSPNHAPASLYFITINLSSNVMESIYLLLLRIIIHNFVKFPHF